MLVHEAWDSVCKLVTARAEMGLLVTWYKELVKEPQLNDCFQALHSETLLLQTWRGDTLF